MELFEPDFVAIEDAELILVAGGQGARIDPEG
jgi:hypothetical protein